MQEIALRADKRVAREKEDKIFRLLANIKNFDVITCNYDKFISSGYIRK